jgi:enamine deaminase RidA (YjgF/YER057c/UK114 family)
LKDIGLCYPNLTKERKDFFYANRAISATHLMASTCIEGRGESEEVSVCVDLYSIKGINSHQIRRLEAINQIISTHNSGRPFERGISVALGDDLYIYISGTTSIDENGICLHKGCILGQLERIFLNISSLLFSVNSSLDSIAHMIVYLRDFSDYKIVNEYISSKYIAIPYVVVLAKTCQYEYLVEIECLAIQ